MSALIRQGGERFTKSDDPQDIELWVDNIWQATWNTKGCKDDFPWAEGGQMFNDMLDTAYEAGKSARSKEIGDLINEGRR